MLAYLFPGQGSQKVGMGQDLVEAFDVARRTFEEADDALGDELSAICFEGPEEQLRLTQNTQPAILTMSVAVLRVLIEQRPDLKPALVAGHSLGEYSALVATGALSFADAVRSVRARGRLMQQAVPAGEGAMSAITGLSSEQVAKVCSERTRPDAVVQPANFNAPSQTVISGHAGAVEAAAGALKEAGAKITPLPVSAPFHCALMQPAADGLAEVLAPLSVQAPSVPVVTNVEAQPNQDADRIKALLVSQVTAPVRWVETVQAIIAAGVDTALELGPGKVLFGLARKIDRKLTVHAAGNAKLLARALDALPEG